jgi:hypothetical protein
MGRAIGLGRPHDRVYTTLEWSYDRWDAVLVNNFIHGRHLGCVPPAWGPLVISVDICWRSSQRNSCKASSLQRRWPKRLPPQKCRSLGPKIAG